MLVTSHAHTTAAPLRGLLLRDLRDVPRSPTLASGHLHHRLLLILLTSRPECLKSFGRLWDTWFAGLVEFGAGSSLSKTQLPILQPCILRRKPDMTKALTDAELLC